MPLNIERPATIPGTAAIISREEESLPDKALPVLVLFQVLQNDLVTR
jgi:hypothetical protein